MCDLPLISDPNLIVGMEHGEDAGVYKIREDLALIQTLDFFTPIVDDPYSFGQIAVTNSLSDVYAMGGIPLTAMNIVCFPIKTMDISILRQILLGGLDKMREAGVVLVGGHSVEDKELKYGLSVTGTVHPDKVLLNTGARPGDLLILTKPLGTGIVSTATKAGIAPEALIAKSVAAMAALNKTAGEIVQATPSVHACTDITGFGLLGHIAEMIEGQDVGILIFSGRVPFFPEVRELAEMGILPEGLYRNKTFRMPLIDLSPTCPEWRSDIFFDPQTSGGLFFALAADQAEACLARLHTAGVVEAAIVGEVLSSPPGRIFVE
ncbi:selenophosphate synthase [Syntrophus gentianae]|uniref:Selenide, water dikinase n=1 Tax=Syntrophus gentianae TaxID=43775 RepID=A0A1H7VD91_9BACT|nr:selenophosphate synthase [Syntrophus gentianae]